MHRPILVASTLVLLAGCGGTPANQPAPAAPGLPSAQAIPPVPQTGEVSIATPQGRVDVRSGPGAAPYPEGIPQYPGATADQSAAVSGAGAGSGRILGFRTADPAAQVIDFYANAASRAGYRVLTRMNSGPSATLILQRNMNDNVSISATRIGNFTQGQIVVAGAGPS